MKLTRVEIIGNQVLLEEILELLEKQIPDQHYTIMPVLYAKGNKGKAFGDTIWVETNFVGIFFVDQEKNIEILDSICKSIKLHSKQNALSMFVTRESTEEF